MGNVIFSQRFEGAVPQKFQALLADLYGQTDTWIDPIDWTTTQQIIDIPVTAVRSRQPLDPELPQETRRCPPGINRKAWTSLRAAATRALGAYVNGDMLTNLNAEGVLAMIFQGIPKAEILLEHTLGYAIGGGEPHGLDGTTERLIADHNPNNVVFLGFVNFSGVGTPTQGGSANMAPEGSKNTGPQDTATHWVLAIVNRPSGSLHYFDSLRDPKEVRQTAVVASLRQALGYKFDSKSVFCYRVSAQNDAWTCGFHVCMTLWVLIRRRVAVRAQIPIRHMNTSIIPSTALPEFISALIRFVGVRVLPAPQDAKNVTQTDTQDSTQAGTKHNAESDTEDTAPVTKKTRFTFPEHSRSVPVGDLLDVRKRHFHEPGRVRAERYLLGDDDTSYIWAGDTYEIAAKRPQPCTPHGWYGWAHFRRKIERAQACEALLSDRKASGLSHKSNKGKEKEQ